MRYFVVLSLVAPACIGMGFAARAAELTSVELESPAFDFALDTQTGTLAATVSGEKKVVLYGSELAAAGGPLKPTASISLETSPREIVYKRTKSGGLFVVSSFDGPELCVLEAATLKQTAKIALPDKITSLATSVVPEDPYVYCTLGMVPESDRNRVDGSTWGVARVDLVRGVTEKILNGPAVKCAVSAQGSYLYVHDSFHVKSYRILPGAEPRGLETLKFLADVPPDKNVKWPSRHSRSIVPDPFELTTATAAQVRSATLELSTVTAGFEPACFFAKRPFVVGVELARGVLEGWHRDDPKKRDLVVASTNDYGIVARLQFPIAMFPKKDEKAFVPLDRGDPDYSVRRFSVFVDEDRNRIVAVNANHAVVVRTADLPLKNEPVLSLKGDATGPLTVGKPHVVRLTVPDNRISMTLVDGPEGAAVTARGLEWTPGAAHVGPNLFRFRLSFEGIERTVPLVVAVERERMPLPIDAMRFVFSTDGRSLFLWNGTVPGSHRNEDHAPQGALVDLVGKTTVGEADLPFAVRDATVDEHFVYVYQAKSQEVAVLDRKTFKSKQTIRLDSEVRWVQAVDGKTLAVGVEDGRWFRYEVPGLGRISEHRMPDTSLSDPPTSDQPPGLARIDEGWRLASGDIYDAALEKPLLATAIPPLATATRIDYFPRRNRHRVFGTNGLPGANVTSFFGRLAEERFGLAGVLTYRRDDEQVPSALRADREWESMNLVLYRQEKAQGNVYRVLPIVKRQAPPRSINTGPPYGGMATVGDHLYVLLGKGLYTFSVAELTDPSDPPRGLAIVPRASAMVIDPAGVTKLSHAVVGGKPPYQFTLAGTTPGARIDAATGEVSVDGPAVVTAAIDLQAGSVTGPQVRGGEWKSPEAVVGYWSEKSAVFETMTGRKPKGVPVALPIEVQVTDAEGAAASLRYFTAVELPRTQVNERIAQVASQVSEAKPAVPAAPGGMPVPPQRGIAPETRDRIRRLEERIGTLEGQLNTMIKLLMEPRAND